MAKKPLILAIERDSDQARLLSEVIHQRLRADLVLAETVERAMTSLHKRVPDIVLIPALLSPREESTLRDGLRANGGDAHVQMLTIPVLAPAVEQPKPRGMLSRFRRDKSQDVSEAGFSPAAFAEQIAEYLGKKGGSAANGADHREHEPGVSAPVVAPAKTTRDVEPATTTEAEPFDLALRLGDEPADPPVDLDAFAGVDAGSATADSPTVTDAVRFQGERGAPAMQETTAAAMTEPAESAGPMQITLSDDNADWTAVMESLRGDLESLTEAPLATDLAPAPKDQTAREEWAGIDPLDSGFPTLLGRLRQLMEDADRMVA